jgi:hypothetical protein
MTDPAQPAELASLEPLEPLETGTASAAASGGDDVLVQLTRGGLAPAYNPYCRDKTFYRFLFCGVMIVLGCMMPFTADASRAGYQYMSGAIYTLIGIALIWSWWGAIAHNRPKGVNWVAMCFVPLLAITMNLIAFDPMAARMAAIEMGWLKDVAAVGFVRRDVRRHRRRLGEEGRAGGEGRVLLAPVRTRPGVRLPGGAAGRVLADRRHRRWRQEEQRREEGQDDGHRREEAEVIRA